MHAAVDAPFSARSPSFLFCCRQRELRDEDRRYREYLRQLREEQQRREKELETICDSEVEKMWDRRVRQWKIEKTARQKLLDEVLASRRQQIQQKRMSRSWCSFDLGLYVIVFVVSCFSYTFHALLFLFSALILCAT